KNAHDWIVRYNDFSGWHTEGFMFSGVTYGGGTNAYFYGNVWHDQVSSGSPSCFWNYNGYGGVDGPFFIYNNTFYNVVITNGQGGDRQFGSGSFSRNNIFWNCV